MKSRYGKAIMWLAIALICHLLLFLYQTEGNYTLQLFGYSVLYFWMQIFVGILVPGIWFLFRKRVLFSNDQGKTICIVNSCAIHGLSWLLTILFELETFTGVGWFTAICIAFFNYNMFVTCIDKKVIVDEKNEITDVAVNELNDDKQEIIDIIDEENDMSNDKKEKIDIVEENRHCTKCGKEIDSSWDYCYYCGNKLK